MSTCKATESFCFVHTAQYIYEEDNKSALERLGQQATFKFRALWSIRDGKGLIFHSTTSVWTDRHVKHSTVFVVIFHNLKIHFTLNKTDNLKNNYAYLIVVLRYPSSWLWSQSSVWASFEYCNTITLNEHPHNSLPPCVLHKSLLPIIS